MKWTKLKNRLLLFHGSATSNFIGILSQGLRIAPPEAQFAGSAFGTGVYFADMSAKSFGYCRGTGNDTIFILLCEVRLLSFLTIFYL